MNKTIGILIAVVVIIGGIVFFRHRSSAPSADYGAATSTSATSASSESINPGAVRATSPGSVATTFTLADVAKHPDSTSCYSAINGNVYDLTNWINQHPGGAQRILSICGRDGSSAFNGQHGSDPRVNSILATMKIGTLAQ